MPTLHVALDEAGDFNFSPKGSKYYIFTAAWTYDPAPLATDLTCLRFGLLKAGDDVCSFHAAEDKQVHRDEVVKKLVAAPNWNFVSLVVEKRKVNPSIREPEIFYPKFAGSVLAFVFKGCVQKGTGQVVTCTDTLPMAKRREAVTKTFKLTARKILPPEVRFDIYHHPSESNKWIQIVDYCCWGVQRKWEKGDPRTYDQIRPRLYKPEIDVCSRGDGTLYY